MSRKNKPLKKEYFNTNKIFLDNFEICKFKNICPYNNGCFGLRSDNDNTVVFYTALLDPYTNENEELIEYELHADDVCSFTVDYLDFLKLIKGLTPYEKKATGLSQASVMTKISIKDDTKTSLTVDFILDGLSTYNEVIPVTELNGVFTDVKIKSTDLYPILLDKFKNAVNLKIVYKKTENKLLIFTSNNYPNFSYILVT